MMDIFYAVALMNVARYSRKNKKAVADSPRQFSYFI